MTGREETLAAIERERIAARTAVSSGNEGKARVCARRMAGAALAWLITVKPGEHRAVDTMTQLNNLLNDPDAAPDVRDAAARLTARVSSDFRYPSASDPVDDAEIIVRYVLAIAGAHGS